MKLQPVKCKCGETIGFLPEGKDKPDLFCPTCAMEIGEMVHILTGCYKLRLCVAKNYNEALVHDKHRERGKSLRRGWQNFKDLNEL